jgi:hypothetical protein
MKPSRYLLSAAIAGIVAGGAAAKVMASDSSGATSADQSNGKSNGKKIKCYNTCTGKGACKTAKHACKGQNGCEGEGKPVLMSAADCTKGGGLTKEPKAPDFPMPPATKPSGI